MVSLPTIFMSRKAKNFAPDMSFSGEKPWVSVMLQPAGC